MITGGCLGGRVRYTAEGPALFGVLCHCRDCQRASGAGHVPVVGVSKADFSGTGDPKSYASIGGSGRTSVRAFCPDCGSLLFGTLKLAPDMVTIYVGSLDEPSVFVPDASMFARSRHEWDIGAKALPEFPEAPPSVAR